MDGEWTIERLVAAFQDRTLPKAAWTHAAHLRVALWHVLRFPAAEAWQRVRSGILALNEAHGTPNTDQGGYHETITRFYLIWIDQFVASLRESAFEVLAEKLVAAAGSNLPLQYYSRQRLFSIQARREWVEPDLAPLKNIP